MRNARSNKDTERAAQRAKSTLLVLKASVHVVTLVFAFLVSNSSWAIFESLKGSEHSGPYPVLDSKLSLPESGGFRLLTWLDNDRLIFTGRPVAEVLADFANRTSPPPYHLRMYIWNTRTNDIQVYVDFGGNGGFCYNELENWIRYAVPGKKNAVKEGKFGEEREVVLDPTQLSVDARKNRGVFYHPLTCKEHPYPPEGSGADRRVLPLYLDHGVLDVWGNQIDGRPIKLYSNDYRKVNELPLPRRAIAPNRIYFSRYKNAYVLSGFTAPPSFSNAWGNWPRGVNQAVYLLSPDGKLKLGGEIPWHEKFREALGVFFTVKGLAYATSRPPENKGLFLVRTNGVVRLLAGQIEAAGVSPDGCKVAAEISMENASKSGGMKVIDLCKGEKQ